jgi:hypothetical protein
MRPNIPMLSLILAITLQKNMNAAANQHANDSFNLVSLQHYLLRK